jgi:hypothetical protein
MAVEHEAVQEQVQVLADLLAARGITAYGSGGHASAGPLMAPADPGPAGMLAANAAAAAADSVSAAVHAAGLRAAAAAGQAPVRGGSVDPAAMLQRMTVRRLVLGTDVIKLTVSLLTRPQAVKNSASCFFTRRMSASHCMDKPIGMSSLECSAVFAGITCNHPPHCLQL